MIAIRVQAFLYLSLCKTGSCFRIFHLDHPINRLNVIRRAVANAHALVNVSPHDSAVKLQSTNQSHHNLVLWLVSHVQRHTTPLGECNLQLAGVPFVQWLVRLDSVISVFNGHGIPFSASMDFCLHRFFSATRLLILFFLIFRFWAVR